MGSKAQTTCRITVWAKGHYYTDINFLPHLHIMQYTLHIQCFKLCVSLVLIIKRFNSVWLSVSGIEVSTYMLETHIPLEIVGLLDSNVLGVGCEQLIQKLGLVLTPVKDLVKTALFIHSTIVDNKSSSSNVSCPCN